MLKTLTFALVTLMLAMPGAAEAKGPKHCPPGLAKKSPKCVPPGLAKKKRAHHDSDRYEDDRYHDDRAERDDDDDWYDDRYDRVRVGDRVVLAGDEYTVVRVDDGRIVLRRDDTLYRLPRTRDGSEYVRIGDALMRIDQRTKDIVEWIRLTDLIFG